MTRTTSYSHFWQDCCWRPEGGFCPCVPCFLRVNSSARPHKGILRSVTKDCCGHLELPGKVCGFCFLENNQDVQPPHSFEMFTRVSSAQPIANAKFMRTLGTSKYLLSLNMHDNQAANTALLDLLALLLSYRQSLPQLPCCTWWRGRRRERDLRKDTIPAPSLWELRHLDRSFSLCPAVLKGV